MNILFISSIQCWGGAEVWLMDIMGKLVERGHAVTLACRKHSPLARKAQERGYDVEPIRFGGDLDPLVIFVLWRIMKDRAIEVVCANTEKDLRAGGIAAILAGVTRIIPSREVDGESGFLVEPMSPSAIAGGVCRLLENPAIARKMGLAGRCIVERKFTLDRMVNGFEAEIREEPRTSRLTEAAREFSGTEGESRPS